MGGTFNPVHMGHLVMAESVMHSIKAEGMVFVPARLHPFKGERQINNYKSRLAMVEAAIGSNRRFVLEKPPLDLQYTIDLIEYLRDKYITAEFSLVIGSDIIEEFVGWHKYEEIVQSVRIIIAARPGHRIRTRKDDNTLDGAERIMIPQYDISSSDIRERVRSRRSIKYMVPEAVEEIIYKEGLYVG